MESKKNLKEVLRMEVSNNTNYSSGDGYLGININGKYVMNFDISRYEKKRKSICSMNGVEDYLEEQKYYNIDYFWCDENLEGEVKKYFEDGVDLEEIIRNIKKIAIDMVYNELINNEESIGGIIVEGDILTSVIKDIFNIKVGKYLIKSKNIEELKEKCGFFTDLPNLHKPEEVKPFYDKGIYIEGMEKIVNGISRNRDLEEEVLC